MAEGLKGLLRRDFALYVRPHFEKAECEVCGSETECLRVHHMTHFQDLLDETLEQLHLEYHKDTDDYTEDELQLIRDVMIAKQMRIEYVTCCQPCHMKLHGSEYGSHKTSKCRNWKIKKVICLNTLDVFNNGAEAAAWCNGSRCAINLCVKGKRASYGKHPETGEKLVWMYYNDYLEVEQQEIENKMQQVQQGCSWKREVICLQTLQVFESGVDAANWCGVSKSAISACCRGQHKTCGKHPETGQPLCWMFYEDWLASAN